MLSSGDRGGKFVSRPEKFTIDIIRLFSQSIYSRIPKCGTKNLNMFYSYGGLFQKFDLSDKV